MRLASWPCGIREAHGAVRERAEQRSSGVTGERAEEAGDGDDKWGHGVSGSGGNASDARLLAPTCGPGASVGVGASAGLKAVAAEQRWRRVRAGMRERKGQSGPRGGRGGGGLGY